MAVFAHADDEMVISPLLARYAREGHPIYLVIATKGELGVTRHANIPKGDSLAARRVLEASCAARNLGIPEPIHLGFGDGSLAKDFTAGPLQKKIDSIFSLYKPNIVITWGPDGGYGHMDHRLVHNVVTEIFQSGRNPYSQRLFYAGFPANAINSIPKLKTDLGNYFINFWKPVKDEYLNVRVRVSAADKANAFKALECYTSQFTAEHMQDINTMLLQGGKDTVYLRSFGSRQGTSFGILD